MYIRGNWHLQQKSHFKPFLVRRFSDATPFSASTSDARPCRSRAEAPAHLYLCGCGLKLSLQAEETAGYTAEPKCRTLWWKEKLCQISTLLHFAAWPGPHSFWIPCRANRISESKTREHSGSVWNLLKTGSLNNSLMIPTSLTCAVQRGAMCMVQALCSVWVTDSSSAAPLRLFCVKQKEDFPVQGRKVYWYKYEKDCMLKPRYTARTRHGTFKVCVFEKKKHVLSVLLLIWLAASKLENTGSGALYSTEDHFETLIINNSKHIKIVTIILLHDYKLLRQYCHCNTDMESKQGSPQRRRSASPQLQKAASCKTIKPPWHKTTSNTERFCRWYVWRCAEGGLQVTPYNSAFSGRHQWPPSTVWLSGRFWACRALLTARWLQRPRSERRWSRSRCCCRCSLPPWLPQGRSPCPPRPPPCCLGENPAPRGPSASLDSIPSKTIFIYFGLSNVFSSPGEQREAELNGICRPPGPGLGSACRLGFKDSPDHPLICFKWRSRGSSNFMTILAKIRKPVSF